jgi:FixJ family two-component response regulator
MTCAAPIVFVVDDDLSVRVALRNLLRSAGHTVEVFPSALEFLSYTGPHDPQCLVVDVCMPGIDGLELERELVERGRALPVVFISGSSNARAINASSKTAAQFLKKPFPDEDLLDAIERSIKMPRSIAHATPPEQPDDPNRDGASSGTKS